MEITASCNNRCLLFIQSNDSSLDSSRNSSPDPYYDSCDEDLKVFSVDSDDCDTNSLCDGDLSFLISQNKLDKVDNLFKRNIIKKEHLSKADNKGRTLLHVACKRGLFEMSILLLKGGSDVNSSSKDMETPLHFACASHNIALVKLLIEYGAILNHSSWFYTPIQIACINYNIHMADCLIKLGCDVNTTTFKSGNVLHCVVEAYNEIVPVNKLLEVVEFLLLAGCNVNAENLKKATPLMIACEKGIVSLVDLLIKVNNLSVTLDKSLLVALKKCNIEIIELLLKNGANPNYQSSGFRDPPPIHSIISMSSEIAIKFLDVLLKYNCMIGLFHKGMTVLHLACIHKKMDLIKYLLKYIKINIPNLCGQTPLHLACLYGHFDVVKLLLDNSCDVNCYYDKNISPLHLCIESKRTDIAKLLLQAGANIYDGASVLKVALHLEKILKPNVSLHKIDTDMLHFLWKINYDIRRDPIFPIEKFMENIDSDIISINEMLFRILIEKSHQILGLQQLCCHVIRQCLGYRLKTDIDKINLPPYLKSLVTYEFL